jgi:hypothetical protein
LWSGALAHFLANQAPDTVRDDAIAMLKAMPGTSGPASATGG